MESEKISRNEYQPFDEKQSNGPNQSWHSRSDGNEAKS